VLSQFLKRFGREPGPSAFRRLIYLLTGSDFWAVEQDRQLAKDPFPVILDFPYNDATPIKEVKIMK